MIHGELHHLISTWGYGAVVTAVGLESLGLPLPGETTLVAAAVYAASTHELSIIGVIAAAALGATIGGAAGWGLGRSLGYRLLLRYGARFGFDQRRLKLGQYLFRRHGGKVIFFGRFVALLRALAAVLGGANRMGWWHFCVANAAGAIVWSALYGAGAYLLGREVHRIVGPLGVALIVAVIVAGIAGYRFLRRHENRLIAAAERELPGPLEMPGKR